MTAANILKEASNRIETTRTENVIKSGKIGATRIYTDNTKSKKYLKSKRKALQKSYDIIKFYYLDNTENSFDALCAIAVLNQFKIYIDGEPIEARCKYTVLVVNQQKIEMPSEWFLNDFYFYLSRPIGIKDSSWSGMNLKEKFQDMIRSLLIPDKDGKTCLDSLT
jgi:hypothetical protein